MSTLTLIKNESYEEVVENLRIVFNDFNVHQPGILFNENILFLIEEDLKEKLDENFVINICAGLEAIGIKFNICYTLFVSDMNDKEYIIKDINGLGNVKYFLMIGKKPEYCAVMKSIKFVTEIKGNYRIFSKVFKEKLQPEYIFKTSLQINKQCRGINYESPPNFPTDTAFIHFILTDKQIFCGTNATKFEAPHIMILCQNKDNMDFVSFLEHLCSKLTGKLENKTINNFIVTFENCFSSKLFAEIGTKMYETVEKWIAFPNIGIAEIVLERNFKAEEKKIKSCVALKYDGGLDSKKILELLNLCKNCNDLRLNVIDETPLPESIRSAQVHYNNINRNYKNFIAPSKNDVFDLGSDEEDYFLDKKFFYPKIKHRNHTIIEKNENFTLYSQW